MEKAREMHMLKKLHKTKYGEPNYCVVFAPIYTYSSSVIVSKLSKLISTKNSYHIECYREGRTQE